VVLDAAHWGMVQQAGRLRCVAGKRSHKRPRPVRRMYGLDGVQSVDPPNFRFRDAEFSICDCDCLIDSISCTSSPRYVICSCKVG